MINTIRTKIEDREYEVDTDSDKIKEPMFLYAQIYRLRKDGTRGRKLACPGEHFWAVWITVRDEVKARTA